MDNLISDHWIEITLFLMLFISVQINICMKKDKKLTHKQFDINMKSKKQADQAKAWLAVHDHEARKKNSSREKLLKAQRVAVDLMANSKHLLNEFQLAALKKVHNDIKNRSSWDAINPKIAERVFKVQFTVNKLKAQASKQP